jgi:DNA-binding NarL/FixJ family response regulator
MANGNSSSSAFSLGNLPNTFHPRQSRIITSDVTTVVRSAVLMTNAAPIRVLIADDSPTALRSVCDYLEFAGGFQVICTASDGVNAVQLASHHRPDLALLDFRMPRLNGLHAAQVLRQAHPDLRILIYSEINGTTLEEECRSHGADGFIAKSRLPDGLLVEIRRLFPGCVL